MKLYISGMFLYPGKVGGAEQYFYNLLKGFHSIGKSRQIEVGIQQGQSIKMDRIIRQFRTREEKIYLNRVINDSLHGKIGKTAQSYSHALFPNYVCPLFPRSETKIFTTIYDLLYKNFPEECSYTKRRWLKFAHNNALKNSYRVITISNSVKNDILKYHHDISADQVEVIHVPIDFNRFEGASGYSKLIGAPFILSVANLYPHKNVHTLIQAYLRLYPRPPRPFKLVLTGQIGKHLRGGNFTPYARKIEELLAECSDIIQTGYISDQDLGDLYRNASIFCFPSVFEGFGMPVSEAMGFGLPTITTQLTSLPEVSLNQALYVESPRDPDSWASVITYALENIDSERDRFAQLSQTVKSVYAPGLICKKYWDLLC